MKMITVEIYVGNNYFNLRTLAIVTDILILEKTL